MKTNKEIQVAPAYKVRARKKAEFRILTQINQFIGRINELPGVEVKEYYVNWLLPSDSKNNDTREFCVTIKY